MRKIIFIGLICTFLFLIIGFAQAEEEFKRVIGLDKEGEKITSTCYCTALGGGWNTWKCSTCTCQQANIVQDCIVGGLITSPVCACCGDCSLEDFIAIGINIANLILRYVGIFALLMFIIGGVVWIGSAGNPQKVQTGKKIIQGALVGMIIVLCASLIIRFVIQSLGVDTSFIKYMNI